MGKKGGSKSKKGGKKRDDFSSMIVDFFGAINWKVAILLFVFGFFILSDSFIEIMANFNSELAHSDMATSKGSMIQLMSIVIGYIIIDLIVKSEVV